MKKYIAILAVATLTFAGCNEALLDIPQKGVISTEDFYKTDADAEAALAAVYYDTFKNFAFMGEVTGYNQGPWFALNNYMADDIYLAGSGSDDCVTEREFHDFRYANDNSVPLGGYTALYRSIHKCNLLINNFEQANMVLTPKMKQFIAEARAMRAFDHFILGMYWGTPPIVDEVLSGAARPVNSESQAAVMTWVANEIDAALPDLLERSGKDDRAGAVRITKGFANAIKGKALMWKGDYAGAKTVLETVIKSGKYDLLPSAEMQKLLHADGKASWESVFEFCFEFDPALVDYFANASRAGWNDHMTFNWRFENMSGGNITDPKIYNTGWGWINPTGKFAEDLIANDGMDSARRKAWIMTYDEYLYDIKWNSDGDDFIPGKTEAKEKDPDRGLNSVGVYACEGYFNWKTVIHPLQDDRTTTGEGNRNLSIMRYAEVLLLYAECCAQLGEKSGLGLECLNMVQNRAGSKYVSKELTLNDVKKEKQFELWLEGCRAADLIRWKDYATLESADSYVPTFRDKLAQGTSDKHEGYVDENGADFYKKSYSDKLGFKTGKHELLPFPKRETDLNPEIKQNPGWE